MGNSKVQKISRTAGHVIQLRHDPAYFLGRGSVFIAGVSGARVFKSLSAAKRHRDNLWGGERVRPISAIAAGHDE